MKRRLFLQAPFLAASLSSLAKNRSLERLGKGFKVEAGKDRFNEEIHFLANRIQCKVSTKDTNGDICIFYNTTTGGPFMHYHYSQDEWFYGMKGKFQFKVGEETFMAVEGDSIFSPRMVPHGFGNFGTEGKLLAVYQPAGTIEEFFKEGSKMKSHTPQELKEMSRRHGIEIVGPPIKID